MNRVRSGQFPNSITEVVYQSGQFSPVASGALSSVLAQGARSDCYDAAREALADPIRWEDASTLTADPDRESRSAISIFINDHRGVFDQAAATFAVRYMKTYAGRIWRQPFFL